MKTILVTGAGGGTQHNQGRRPMADVNDREERLKQFTRDYEALAHAIQTGVMYELELEQPGISALPVGRLVKHLRTGTNLRARDHGALVRLLVRKGVFTEEEYEREVLEQLREEKGLYERRLTEAYGGGTKITLS